MIICKTLNFRFTFKLTHLLVLALPVVWLAALSSSALVIPEAELASSFASRVRPFFDGQFTFGSLPGQGGVTLRYAKREVEHGRGTLLVVNGRSEFLAKYAELFYDLKGLPLSFYIFDQRGQGASDRLLPDHDRGHVEKFQDYVDDLSIFIDTVVRPDRGRPLFILSHSLGGVVAGLYADSHPEAVQGLILSSPMLAINTPPFPNPVARLLARSATLLGLGGCYVPGGGPYDPAKKPFVANDLTRSEARFDLNRALITTSPKDALGSPTYGWVAQAFIGMDRLSANHHHLTMPVLLLSAGADTVVDTLAAAEFCRTLPKCTLVELPGARHEILMEEDRTRDRALALIREFVACHTPSVRGGQS